MLRFIRNRTALPYFSSLAWSIGNIALQIDAYRSKSQLVTMSNFLIRVVHTITRHDCYSICESYEIY